jgi:hypothetical protein
VYVENLEQRYAASREALAASAATASGQAAAVPVHECHAVYRNAGEDDAPAAPNALAADPMPDAGILEDVLREGNISGNARQVQHLQTAGTCCHGSLHVVRASQGQASMA